MSKCSTPIVYKLLSCLFNFFLIQSPILVMHNSVTTRKTPGSRIIHQAPVSSAFSDSDSILPHEITSSGSPIPMKLNVDSSTIALRIFMTTINMIDEAKLGVRCFHKTCQKLPPIHLAAMTYPLFRICFTSVRTTLAIPGQLVIPIINEILKMLDICNNANMHSAEQE